jgi:general stress protein YciG
VTTQADPGPYSRVYWRFKDEYSEVFDDPLTLGTWLQLLVFAEGAWPSQPHLPRRVKPRQLAALTGAGLIELMPGDRYRVKGLDAERQRRAEAGRKGGLASGVRRTTVERPFNERSTTVEPRRDEQSKDETRQDEQRVAALLSDDEPEAPLVQWLAQHKCYLVPGNGFHRQLITGVERLGVQPILTMFDKLSRAGVEDGDTKGFVFGALDALKPKPDLKRVEAEDRERAEREALARRQQRTQDYIASMRPRVD